MTILTILLFISLIATALFGALTVFIVGLITIIYIFAMILWNKFFPIPKRKLK